MFQQIVKLCKICIHCSLATFSVLSLCRLMPAASPQLLTFFKDSFLCQNELAWQLQPRARPWDPRTPEPRGVQRSSNSLGMQCPTPGCFSAPDAFVVCLGTKKESLTLTQKRPNETCQSEVARMKNQTPVKFSDTHSQTGHRFKFGKYPKKTCFYFLNHQKYNHIWTGQSLHLPCCGNVVTKIKGWCDPWKCIWNNNVQIPSLCSLQEDF